MAAIFDVIIPGLLQLTTLDLDDKFLQSRLPALNHILRYSRKRVSTMFDFESMLADGLGLSSSNLAFASAFDDQFSPGQSLICQPVHLKPDMRNAMVILLDNSERTSEEIDLVINDLFDFFKDDLKLTRIEQRLWLMRLKNCRAAVNCPHVLSVTGRKADPYIEQSRDMLEWYQLTNEMQMYMHSHRVNHKRQQEGLATINSLWCWGGGESEVLSEDNIRVYCDDFLVNSFLAKSGLKAEKLQDISAENVRQNNICVDLSVLQALKSQQNDDIASIIERIETTVLQPVLRNVKSGHLNLRLRSGYDFDFELDRLSSFKFWRKPVSLKTLIAR